MPVLSPKALLRRSKAVAEGLVRGGIERNPFGRALNGVRLLLSNKNTAIYFVFLLSVLLLGLVGPHIAPYDANERVRSPEGGLMANEPPSLAHPLGTTDVGYDVFSRILIGARPTMIAGMLGGTMIITIGLTVGIVSGYAGGRIDDALMRVTDIAYGVPVLPTALLLAGLFGVGFLESIVIIAMIIWRGSARVIRSQVLQIKQRPFITALRGTGASNVRIIVRHILPNVAPMAMLFFAIGVGYTIIIQAGLAFIGVSSPFVPSWGVMVRNAFNSGAILHAWWWSVPPGTLLGLTVMSTFMLGRNIEVMLGEAETDADEALAQA